MISVVVAVRDSALDAFLQPFVVPSIGMALRSFSDEVNKAESPMNAHPEDYELFVVGQWSSVTGEFSPPDGGAIRSIARARDVLREVR